MGVDNPFDIAMGRINRGNAALNAAARRIVNPALDVNFNIPAPIAAGDVIAFPADWRPPAPIGNPRNPIFPVPIGGNPENAQRIDRELAGIMRLWGMRYLGNDLAFNQMIEAQQRMLAGCFPLMPPQINPGYLMMMQYMQQMQRSYNSPTYMTRFGGMNPGFNPGGFARGPARPMIFAQEVINQILKELQNAH